MAGRSIQKKYHFEIEITVQVDEIGEEHLQKDQAAGLLARLKRLQQALMDDGPALTNQMRAAAAEKLQEYMDGAVTQGTLAELSRLAEQLDPEDQDYFAEHLAEFSDLTRPLRLSCQKAHITKSRVYEEQNPSDQSHPPRLVWVDLMVESEFGRMLRQIVTPGASRSKGANNMNGHYLLARHLTQQLDGVHFDGQCSCGQVFQGTADQEDQALDTLWKTFMMHYDSVRMPVRRAWLWSNDWFKDVWEG
jgi:hypothetical protein